MEKLKNPIDAFIAQNTQNILRDIARLVAVPSVQGAPQAGKPFGEGPAAALQTVLAIAEELGLPTQNDANYIGWAQLTGSGSKQIATITHVDVVPEGNGWSQSPYELQQRDGWLIGRGVADDKGPSILCLYALAFLQQSGIPLRHTVRALFGTNEETGMQDVAYYLAHHPAPDFCFSPDAEFPLCNGEKGLFHGTLVSPVLQGGNILEFSGGVAPNVVPDRTTCLVKGDIAALQPAAGIATSAENGAIRIQATGKGGHAAMPAGTVNAIGLVVDFLLQNKLGTSQEQRTLQALQKLHHHTDGSGLGIAATDTAFDPLTVVGGVITLQQGQLRQSVDCRFPTSITGQQIAQRVQQAMGEGATLQVERCEKPFFIAPDAAPIRTLLDCYSTVTGEAAQPFTMGGGTYARHFPQAVSFGPERRGEQLPPFAGPMHGANEGASLQGLLQALKIYILALVRLQECEL